MASFTQRGKYWEARVYYYDKGKRQSVSKSGFRTKKEAQSYALEVQKDVESGSILNRSDKSFIDYFWKWFETYKEPTVTSRTRLTYVHAYHVLQKYMDPIPIGDMTRSTYQDFITKFGKDHAKSTVHKCNSLYHAALKNALYDQVVKRDFIENATLVYNPDHTWQVEYLNMEELERLTENVADSLNPHYTSRYMILTAIYTGMRIGEIQALTWQNINRNFKTISVEHSWNEIESDKSKRMGPTKNASSKRIIRINDELLDILYQLPHDDSKQQVFINQFKTVPTTTAVNKTLRSIMKEVGIKRDRFHFHSLRHTHVAYLLANGVDLYAISKRLGHADIGTTSRKYAYMIEEYKARTDDEIVSKLAKLGKPKIHKNYKKVNGEK